MSVLPMQVAGLRHARYAACEFEARETESERLWEGLAMARKYIEVFAASDMKRHHRTK